MSHYGREPDGDAKSTGIPGWQGTGYGLLLNRSRSPFEQGCANYVELTFETGLACFKMGDALSEKIDTPIDLVETPVNLAETLVGVRLKLVETLVYLVETLVGVRLNLAETLVDPPFHTIQGGQRHCCQSNAYGEDANKNRKDAGELSHGNRECNTRSAPAIQPCR